MPPGETDDVNLRETRLQALINVLGFANLDDLENFIYLHGTVKVVPVAQRDTLPLDETQTQASDEQRARRRLDRLHENAQLKSDLERAKADLEWHRVELQRERDRGEELVQDKKRLLDALGAGASSDHRGGLGVRAVSPADPHSSLAADITTSSDLPGTQPIIKMAFEHEAGAEGFREQKEGDISRIGRVQATSGACGSTANPPPPTKVVSEARLSSPFPVRAPSPVLPQLNTPIRDHSKELPRGSADSAGASTAQAATPLACRSLGTAVRTPISTAMAVNSAGPPSTLTGSPSTSALRKIALYPKLLSRHRQAYEAVREAQVRLSQLEQRLLEVTEVVRSAVLANFGPAPDRIDLGAFSAAPELPIEPEKRAEVVSADAFKATYRTLIDQEMQLSRQDAVVRKWIAAVDNLLSGVPSTLTVSTTAAAPVHSSPAPLTPGAVRKRRRVSGASVSAPAGSKAGQGEPTCATEGRTPTRASIATPTTNDRALRTIGVPLTTANQQPPPPSAGLAARDASGVRVEKGLSDQAEGSNCAADMRAYTGPTGPTRLASPSRQPSTDENGSPAASNDFVKADSSGHEIFLQGSPPRGTHPKSLKRTRRCAAAPVSIKSEGISDTACDVAAQSVENDRSICPTTHRRPPEGGEHDPTPRCGSLATLADRLVSVKSEPRETATSGLEAERSLHAGCEAPETTSLGAPTALGDVWYDLDALTPPAVDEETRKKLKKRNQLKRRRQREVSGKSTTTEVTPLAPGPSSVPRRKTERQRMLAEACESCTAYYQRAGKPVQCAHVGERKVDRADHYLAMRARDMEERLQDNGRHRVNQATAAIPLDYWQFGSGGLQFASTSS
ncbi:hypothetical protein JCM10908_004448 [Rhodotorula pacifica]|uniref:uncharacterized protein n=1 Tax=Rhodotorula pacifica TaxID=1495444 RepID=UPI00317FB99E